MAARVALLANLALLLVISINLNSSFCKSSEVVDNVVSEPQQQLPAGVSRDINSFCAGRPSLPVDLAAMVVHVKRNVSFNYKLYLFSDEHVFQTGQIVPRDHFRVHLFPSKVKRLADFWPTSDQIPQLDHSKQMPIALNKSSHATFNLKRFLQLVPLGGGPNKNGKTKTDEESVDILAGDGLQHSPNKLVNFDTDFQLQDSEQARNASSSQSNLKTDSDFRQQEHLVLPVGSFSSFQANLTYLVRKDFGQILGEIVRLSINPSEFVVEKQAQIVFNASLSEAANLKSMHQDYQFLAHKMLANENTRITSISQVYEDWITRNFYTLVYVQRREQPAQESAQNAPVAAMEIVTDRLVFRGSSAVLLGAEQLDQPIKASAFITEKAGLHYYLEFLAHNKFQVGAIDWQRRPFKFLDAIGFPIKTTLQPLDNEELLLCPPAVCFSEQPIDEIVAYGRIQLPERLQRHATLLAGSPTGNATGSDDANLIDMDELVQTVRNTSLNSLKPKLHLRDWTWELARQLDGQNGSSRFRFDYNQARRQEFQLKAVQDTYGFQLTGHEIDASYRVYNELNLIVGNQLITINYNREQGKQIVKLPIGSKFKQLSSSLVDPISAAFYDRYENQLYFFKGYHYLGYDYASGKPLSQFLEPHELSGPELELDSNPRRKSDSEDEASLMLTSKPVSLILGKQLYVDGIYHDLATDLVYVFTGMKFLTFEANQFKNGSFKMDGKEASELRCVNRHLLSGCHFDRAFESPCKLEAEEEAERSKLSGRLLQQQQSDESKMQGERDLAFSDFQQLRLRKIALKSRLLRLLESDSSSPLSKLEPVQKLVIEPWLTRAPKASDDRNFQEQAIVYLIMSMALLSLLVASGILFAVFHGGRSKSAHLNAALQHQQQQIQPQLDRVLSVVAQKQQQRQADILTGSVAKAHSSKKRRQEQQPKPQVVVKSQRYATMGGPVDSSAL